MASDFVSLIFDNWILIIGVIIAILIIHQIRKKSHTKIIDLINIEMQKVIAEEEPTEINEKDARILRIKYMLKKKELPKEVRQALIKELQSYEKKDNNIKTSKEFILKDFATVLNKRQQFLTVCTLILKLP